MVIRVKLRLSEVRAFPTSVAMSALRAVGLPPTSPVHAYAVVSVGLGRFCPVPCYALASGTAKPVAPANTVYSWRGHGGLYTFAVDGAVVSPQGPTVLEVALWVSVVHVAVVVVVVVVFAVVIVVAIVIIVTRHHLVVSHCS